MENNKAPTIEEINAHKAWMAEQKASAIEAEKKLAEMVQANEVAMEARREELTADEPVDVIKN